MNPIFERIISLLENETDWVAAMATVACELHHSHAHFHWTGFYRRISPDLLKIGPYQGGHGCLEIPLSRGVCGSAARSGLTQHYPDVSQAADHIACASTTRSEVVVPILNALGEVFAVLDVDSDHLDAFSDADISLLESIGQFLGARYGSVRQTTPVLI